MKTMLEETLHNLNIICLKLGSADLTFINTVHIIDSNTETAY